MTSSRVLDFNDNYGDLEEDQEPGKDLKPEPPPQPPLYRPSRPSIKLSFVGTNSFALRTSNRCPGAPFGAAPAWEDGSVFRSRDLNKIKELKSHFYYWLHYYVSGGIETVTEDTKYEHIYYCNEFLPWYGRRPLTS